MATFDSVPEAISTFTQLVENANVVIAADDVDVAKEDPPAQAMLITHGRPLLVELDLKRRTPRLDVEAKQRASIMVDVD